jgi:hypothetical protein
MLSGSSGIVSGEAFWARKLATPHVVALGPTLRRLAARRREVIPSNQSPLSIRRHAACGFAFAPSSVRLPLNPSQARRLRFRVCAVQRCESPVGDRPTRQPVLLSVATQTAKEVTILSEALGAEGSFGELGEPAGLNISERLTGLEKAKRSRGPATRTGNAWFLDGPRDIAEAWRRRPNTRPGRRKWATTRTANGPVYPGMPIGTYQVCRGRPV